MSALLRLAAAVLLLALGLIAGFAASSMGIHNPFSNVSPQARSGPASSPAPALTATSSSAQVQVVGSVAVTTPTCQNTVPSFQIRNLGAATAVTVSIGSPDAPGARFALAPGGVGSPTLTTAVAAQNAATVYALNAPPASFSIDVLAPAGTVHLSASAC